MVRLYREPPPGEDAVVLRLDADRRRPRYHLGTMDAQGELGFREACNLNQQAITPEQELTPEIAAVRLDRSQLCERCFREFFVA